MSRITIHLKDDPTEHEIKLDGTPWTEVASMQVEIGHSPLVNAIAHIPIVTMRYDSSESIRLVGRCRPVTGLPPDRLVEVKATFGHLPDALKKDRGESAALYIDSHRVHFDSMRLYVAGGQQVFLEVDRVRRDLPADSSGQFIHEWLSMFLVRGYAGNDLMPFDFPPEQDTLPPTSYTSSNYSGYNTPEQQEVEAKQAPEVLATKGELP